MKKLILILTFLFSGVMTAHATLPNTIGVNLSGNEYSWESLPTNTEVTYLKSQGIKLVRLPYAWEKLQPVLNGPLSTTEVIALQNFITLASLNGIQVIIDIHNYARYNTNWAAQVAKGQNLAEPCNPGLTGSNCITLGYTLTTANLVDFWTKLATVLKGRVVGYDLMNEPNTLANYNVWPIAAQATINAIRTVDTTTTILLEGNQWSSAQYWGNNPGFPLKDPSNNTVYEAHSYWDNGSGQYTGTYSSYCPTSCPTRGVTLTQPFVTWLKQNNVKGFIGEFGVPGNDPNWLPVLDSFISYVKTTPSLGVATYWNYTYDEPPGKNPWWVTTNYGGPGMQLNPEAPSTPPQWQTIKKY